MLIDENYNYYAILTCAHNCKYYNRALKKFTSDLKYGFAYPGRTKDYKPFEMKIK